LTFCSSLNSHYQVLKEYDQNKDYSIRVQPRFAKFFSLLKKDDIINPTEFVHENHGNLGTKEISGFEKLWVIRKGISLGINMGIIKKIEIHPMSFKEFSQLETVQYFPFDSLHNFFCGR